MNPNANGSRPERLNSGYALQALRGTRNQEALDYVAGLLTHEGEVLTRAWLSRIERGWLHPSAQRPQHFLYFFPLPHGQRSLGRGEASATRAGAKRSSDASVSACISFTRSYRLLLSS